jgi:hypothetical protein
MVEHGQQLGVIGVQPLQQAIKSDEAERVNDFDTSWIGI